MTIPGYVFKHQCRCAGCDPRLDPNGPRLGPRHFAVRFGDHILQACLDGEPIVNCYELHTDLEVGWLINLPAHRCSNCGLGACCSMVQGKFSVEAGIPGSGVKA
jgi:hypothetical protein